MKYGRIENNTVAEYREFAPGDIPEHKTFLWLPVEDLLPEYNEFYEFLEGPAIEIHLDKIVFAYTVIPKETAHLQYLVKKEAERRIIEVYPLWKQNNMLSDKITLLNKIRTAEEEQQLIDIDAGLAYINHIRQCSNVIETMTPIPENYMSDTHW